VGAYKKVAGMFFYQLLFAFFACSFAAQIVSCVFLCGGFFVVVCSEYSFCACGSTPAAFGGTPFVREWGSYGLGAGRLTSPLFSAAFAV